MKLPDAVGDLDCVGDVVKVLLPDAHVDPEADTVPDRDSVGLPE